MHVYTQYGRFGGGVNNNNNNNNHDNIYSAVIMTEVCESSLGSSGECRAAPSGRRPSDQAT